MKRHVAMLVLSGLLIAGLSCQKQEEVQEKAAAPAQLSSEQVVGAIEAYITSNLGADSTFAVEDTVAGTTWKVQLDSIHTVQMMEESQGVACADMSGGEAHLDVDFYVKLQDSQPQVTGYEIHKVNDVARK